MKLIGEQKPAESCRKALEEKNNGHFKMVQQSRQESLSI